MFLSALQVVGAAFSAEIPFPVGPRKAGQSSAEREVDMITAPIAKPTSLVIMGGTPIRRTIAPDTKRRQKGRRICDSGFCPSGADWAYLGMAARIGRA